MNQWSGKVNWFPKIRFQRYKRDRLFLSKIIIVGLLIVIQIVLFAISMCKLGNYQGYFEIICTIISGIVVFVIINRKDNPAYKLAWSVLILTFPLFGGLFYLIVAGNRSSRRFIRRLQLSISDSYRLLPQDERITQALRKDSDVACMQSDYIRNYALYPVYSNTSVEYYPFGENCMEELLRAIASAKRFIFLEYFIIRNGALWNCILDILERKAQEGIDVRVLYDDFGSVATIPIDFRDTLQRKGIACESFNPFIPLLTIRLNNRDHRKIAIIDGIIGFTGGINLADEYVNITHPFGVWKDTSVKLRGAAVWSLTVMFLQMWDYTRGITENFDEYRGQPIEIEAENEIDALQNQEGYVQPYSDSPLDEEIVGENIYLNLINHAKASIKVMTPYLVLDHEMVTALSLAAKNGVDVRIIIPGIPDKKLVYELTLTNARALLEHGVKIYQYLPGFTHAKVMIADDAIATVGTVNLDYRSLYLHFECGVWMYQCECIRDIVKDFDETLDECKEMTFRELDEIRGVRRLWQGVLQLVAPLL